VFPKFLVAEKGKLLEGLKHYLAEIHSVFLCPQFLSVKVITADFNTSDSHCGPETVPAIQTSWM
jgi:hypothetical protein